MPKLKKRVKTAYLFDNGNLAVFDSQDCQIPELQGQFSMETLKRILLEAEEDCEFSGFKILPYGWFENADEWAKYFREAKMSYQEIKQL